MPTYQNATNDFFKNYNGGLRPGNNGGSAIYRPPVEQPQYSMMATGSQAQATPKQAVPMQQAKAMPMQQQSKATSTGNYYDDFANLINNQYNGAIGNLDKLQEADKQQIGQQFDQYRNQASVNAAKNQMALKEQMAMQGLFKSGDNITASTQIGNQRSSDINQANLGESNSYAKLQQEKYRQMMEYEMQRQNALRDALTTSKEWDYRDSRDKITDDRYQKEWDYNTGRDKLEDDRYKKEWDYNVGRDGIEDSRYKSEWEYKKQQDALDQSNWERQFAKTGSSGGGGSSSSYGSGSTKDNVWSEFSQQFNGSSPSYAAQWLGANKDEIIDAVGQTEYNKMSQVAYEQQRKYNDDQKRKKENKYQSY